MNEEMQTISQKTSITRFGLTCEPNWVSDKDTSVSDFRRIKSDNRPLTSGRYHEPLGSG
jgi:hypothetical protein